MKHNERTRRANPNTRVASDSVRPLHIAFTTVGRRGFSRQLVRTSYLHRPLLLADPTLLRAGPSLPHPCWLSLLRCFCLRYPSAYPSALRDCLAPLVMVVPVLSGAFQTAACLVCAPVSPASPLSLPLTCYRLTQLGEPVVIISPS